MMWLTDKLVQAIELGPVMYPRPEASGPEPWPRLQPSNIDVPGDPWWEAGHILPQALSEWATS